MVIVSRHLKGKVFVLLDNAKVAVFRRFAGTDVITLYFNCNYVFHRWGLGLGQL